LVIGDDTKLLYTLVVMYSSVMGLAVGLSSLLEDLLNWLWRGGDEN
jgi:hypothetical protein